MTPIDAGVSRDRCRYRAPTRRPHATAGQPRRLIAPHASETLNLPHRHHSRSRECELRERAGRRIDLVIVRAEWRDRQFVEPRRAPRPAQDDDIALFRLRGERLPPRVLLTRRRHAPISRPANSFVRALITAFPALPGCCSSHPHGDPVRAGRLVDDSVDIRG
jgi:hypothetical protein